MQVGDAFVGIHHGHARAYGILRGQVGFDLGAYGFRQLRQARDQIADAVVGIESGLVQHCRMLGQHIGVESFNRNAEHNRIGHLHHGRFQVQ